MQHLYTKAAQCASKYVGGPFHLERYRFLYAFTFVCESICMCMCFCVCVLIFCICFRFKNGIKEVEPFPCKHELQAKPSQANSIFNSSKENVFWVLPSKALPILTILLWNGRCSERNKNKHSCTIITHLPSQNGRSLHILLCRFGRVSIVLMGI